MRRSHRMRVRRRRALALVPIAPLVVVGSACLAANVVPVTYAGTTTVAVTVPTALTPGDDAKVDVAQEDKHDYFHFINVSAVLTTQGLPLVGQQVTFSAAGGTICVAMTDHSGRADCPSDTKVDADSFTETPTTFTASFVGHDGLATSTASAALRSVG